MPLPLPAGPIPDPILDARRACMVLLLPVLVGVTMPWAAWAAMGWVDANGLAVASLAMLAVYLQFVFWLGCREAALRKRLGRRYRPPSADIALTVSMGLAACLVAPGLSSVALVQLVGLPRAAGLIDTYDPQTLGITGATIDLSQVIPGRAALDVIPGGVARITVPRFGLPTSFSLPWSATPAEFCIAPDQCLAVDRRSGRVSVHATEVGRIIAVGSVGAGSTDFTGAPWEILNLFR